MSQTKVGDRRKKEMPKQWPVRPRVMDGRVGETMERGKFEEKRQLVGGVEILTYENRNG